MRDATRIGSTIYAVGTWTAGGRIDGALWTLDGVNAPVRTALPDFCVTGGAGCTQNVVAGEAITPDAQFFASQARSSDGPTAVRVTRSPLGNLNLTPTPPFTGTRTARAISDDGSILYGLVSMDIGGGIFRNRAVRFENGTATVLFPQPADSASGYTIFQNVLSRGASSDGAVAVGVFSTSNPAAVDSQAFRYVHGAGTTLIPLLDGGTYNIPIAITGDGDMVVLTGDTPDLPVRDVYTYAPSATPQVTRLGVPNLGMTPGSIGGVTDDGSVVVINANAAPDRYIYFHNRHGWFHLMSALGSGGVNLDGWSNLQVQGMNGDGTMLWGTGLHHDVPEGFVAEFAPDFLEDFNPAFAPPADTSIVGAWALDGDVTVPEAVAVFTAEGAYYLLEEDTFEWGSYTFDSNGLVITTRHDTNGGAGLSSTNGSVQPLAVVGDTLVADGEVQAQRIAGAPGSIAGAWVHGEPTQADSSMVMVFGGTGYLTMQDFPDGEGAEMGTFTWDPITHELVATAVGGEPNAGNFVTLSPDARGLHVVDEGGEEFDFARVVDPATIPVITSALSAGGTATQPFAFDVTATNATTFSATGLPEGLSIDAATGQIRGTPGVGGQFPVMLRATNANGVSDIETLTLTIAIPTPVGQNVVVEPEVPEGQGPVTLSFSEVTSGGTTTVTVIDQSEVPPPGNVSVGGVIYEVTTTATYEGLVTLCFSYEGIDFGDAQPRLFHYENNVWVDITTGVDPLTKTICGATTSLSPFAVLVSNVVRTGFHAPVNPIAGFLNTAKGGSTVPLKFNVFVNGTEQKTTDGLELTQQQIHCDSSAPEDPVEITPSSVGSGLRYVDTSFVYNWRMPKTPGLCYMIRMTTVQDGLALTARFKVK
jgi:hypothetical protein